MATSLGLKIGSTTCVAVSGTESGLGAALVRGPVLELAPDSSPELVDRPGPHRVTGFADRVGDPVALVTDDGRQYTGEDLYAAAMAALAADAGAWDADAVVLACPNEWQDYTIDALRAAAERQELAQVTVVPEAIAAVTALSQGPVDRIHSRVDDVTVVYDLGGSSLDVAVVRTGAEPEIIGRPLRSEEISGAQFDHLVLGHVLDSVGATDAIDPFDSATVEGLAELRIRCAAAREALSSDTETVVSIDLPGIRTEARLVRSELEELLRGPLSSSMALVIEALQFADVELGAVSTILLIGGGSSTPLVSELASSMLRVPIAVTNDPATTSATGAALLASSAAQAAAAAASVAVVPAKASGSDEVAALGSHVITPAPRTRKPEPASMSRGKRTAIVVGVAAAIAVLTAGGLSVGTALSEDSTPKPAAAESSVSSTSTTSSTAPNGSPAGSSTDGNGPDGAKTTGTVTTGSDGRPTTAAPKRTTAAPAPGAPATAAPQTGASVPAPAPGGTAAPAPAPAPGGDTGGGGETPPAENPVPAPAPGSGPGSELLQLPGQVLGGTGAAVGGLLGGLGG